MEEMIVTFVALLIIIACLCLCCSCPKDEQVHDGFSMNHHTVTTPLEHNMSTQPGLIGQRTFPIAAVQRQRAELQEMDQLKEGQTCAANNSYENVSTGQIWLPFNPTIPQDSPATELNTGSICTSFDHLYQTTCDDISVANAHQSIDDLYQNNSFKNSSMCLNSQTGTSVPYFSKMLPPSLPDLSNPIRQTVDCTNGVVRNTSRIVFYQNLAFNDMTQAESITIMQSDVTTSLCRTCRKPLCQCSSDNGLSKP